MSISSHSSGSEAVWLSAAYDLLTTGGVETVKITAMSQRLGLSRTGFYWHFKDRDALLDAMVDRWEQKNTGNLVARADAYAESLAEAMFNLFDCWLEPDLFDSQLDLAIRNWARTDPAVKARLDSADAARRDALTAMFARHGCAPDQAFARAMTVIYTQIGYISMQADEPQKIRIARMPAYVEVYTGIKPTPKEIERFTARHSLQRARIAPR